MHIGDQYEAGKFTRLSKCQAKFYSTRMNFPVPKCPYIITTHTMESANASAEALKKQILDTETELLKLKAQLAEVEYAQALESLSVGNEPGRVTPTHKWPLSLEEYKRYGRQMIVPSVGIQGILYVSIYIHPRFDLELSFVKSLSD